MNVKNLNKFAVICIGAGKSQIPVITKAKSLGLIVIAIDQNKYAPGFKYVDFKICLSTYNAEAIIKKLDKLKSQFKLIGILNRSSGPPVITTAKISKHLNLPGVPVLSARKLVNKDKMRIALDKQNIPSTKYKILYAEKYNSINITKLPVVIKPALSLVGKSGVSVVFSKNKLQSSIKYAIKNTINKKILVEEFLKGPDLSFVSFVNNGKLFSICLLEEINIINKDGTISGKGFKTYDSNINNWLQQANNIAKKIISKFNIKRSPLSISLRPDSKNNLKLIEVHLDMGGDELIEGFYPKALSFDYLKFAVEMATGNIKNKMNFKIKPTAIYYKNFSKRLKKFKTDRKYKVFTASTKQLLEKKILKVNI
jgi:formate-dependent phosphoribosylglycinamide formyltransferase (GAR transformylase)